MRNIKQIGYGFKMAPREETMCFLREYFSEKTDEQLNQVYDGLIKMIDCMEDPIGNNLTTQLDMINYYHDENDLKNDIEINKK